MVEAKLFLLYSGYCDDADSNNYSKVADLFAVRLI